MNSLILFISIVTYGNTFSGNFFGTREQACKGEPEIVIRVDVKAMSYEFVNCKNYS
jgi:hypothetical protein